MATARRRSIAASDFRWDIPLSGTKNGVNTVFTIPGGEKAIHSGNIVIRVLYNGQRLQIGAGSDFTVSESGGAGTGFDTITLAIAPESDDNVVADFILFR